jgi:hypothetical protein
VRLALWTPGPGKGWVAALAPLLAAQARLDVLDRQPPSPPAADLDIYHLADDPAHGFVYDAVLRRPGLVVLEEWNLHRLVYGVTAGRGDATTYCREARRAHGATGEFVARQVLRKWGGRLPTLLPLNGRVLEAGLGFVSATEALRARLVAAVPGTPILGLPLPFLSPPALPGRATARATLGLSPDRLVVVAVEPAGAVGPPDRVVRALDGVGARVPRAAVLWVREEGPALAAALGGADLVVALEDPMRSGLGRAIPLAVAAGRPTLVTAGSGAAIEMPEGVVARVSPGPAELDELVALVRRLLADEPLRSSMGRLARTFAAERSDAALCARALMEIVPAVSEKRVAVERELTARRGDEVLPAAGALEELRWAARELSVDLPPDVGPLVASLFGGREG